MSAIGRLHQRMLADTLFFDVSVFREINARVREIIGSDYKRSHSVERNKKREPLRLAFRSIRCRPAYSVFGSTCQYISEPLG
jgi:hypothetical protein